MVKNSTKWIVIAAVMVLGIAGITSGFFQNNGADSTALEPAASASGSSAKPEIKSNNTTADTATAEANPAEGAVTTAAMQTLVSDEGSMVENIDDNNAENAEEVFNTAQLSETEEQIDFQMMNPEIVSAETDVAQNFEIVTSEVNWDDALQHAPLPESMLSIEQTEVVEQSRIPVMLPPKQSLLSDGVLTIGDTWYAASLNDEDVNVLIEGSNASVHLSETSEEAGVGTFDSYMISRDMGMVTVALNAFGVVYTVTVECADQSNSACVDDSYINGLVNSLLLASKQGDDDGA